MSSINVEVKEEELQCLKCNRICTAATIKSPDVVESLFDNSIPWLFYKNCFSIYNVFDTSIQHQEYVENKTSNDGCLYCSKYVNKVMKYIKSVTDNVIQTACKHQGKIIGGFVRDYLIHQLELDPVPFDSVKDEVSSILTEILSIKYLSYIVEDYLNYQFIPTKDQDPKDIDIWVQDKNQVDEILQDFVNQGFGVMSRYSALMDYNEEKGNNHYNFPLLQYIISYNGVVIWLDFIISKEPPTDDFSFNLLIYDGAKIDCQPINNNVEFKNDIINNFQLLIPNTFTVEDIINQIKNKTGYVLPRYIQLMISSFKNRITARFERMIRNKKYFIFNQNLIINKKNLTLPLTYNEFMQFRGNIINHVADGLIFSDPL